MRINIRSIVIAASLGAAVAVTGLTGCANTHGQSYGHHWDDQRTVSHVKKNLNNEPVFKFPGVNVTSYEGVVQLSGFVQTEDQRKRAGEIASTVQGVREVVNNILIKPGGGEITPAGHTNAPVRMGQPAASKTAPPTTPNAPAAPEQNK